MKELEKKFDEVSKVKMFNYTCTCCFHDLTKLFSKTASQKLMIRMSGFC